MIEVNDQLGIVYERVHGKSIVYSWRDEPFKLFYFARLLAELQADIHSYEVAGLPLQRQRLGVKIRAMLPQALQEVTLNALANLPDGGQLCHGDLHPNNVLITERGPIIVDWSNATQGDPLADVARTSLLIAFGTKSPGPINPWLLKVIRILFHRCYIKRYQELQAWDQKQFRAWRPVVAAAHLDPNNAKQQKWLLGLIKSTFRRQIIANKIRCRLFNFNS
jgi:aminoglycoside phosphotransferase (APT) family kinase protein